MADRLLRFNLGRPRRSAGEQQFGAGPAQSRFCQSERFFQFSRGFRRHRRVARCCCPQDLEVICDAFQLILLLIAANFRPRLDVEYNRNNAPRIDNRPRLNLNDKILLSHDQATIIRPLGEFNPCGRTRLVQVIRDRTSAEVDSMPVTIGQLPALKFAQCRFQCLSKLAR